jgi:hypothetical protein
MYIRTFLCESVGFVIAVDVMDVMETVDTVLAKFKVALGIAQIDVAEVEALDSSSPLAVARDGDGDLTSDAGVAAVETLAVEEEAAREVHAVGLTTAKESLAAAGKLIG